MRSAGFLQQSHANPIRTSSYTEAAKLVHSWCLVLKMIVQESLGRLLNVGVIGRIDADSNPGNETI